MPKIKKKLAEKTFNKKAKNDRKSFNPFEVHINKQKYEILGQKLKNDRGLPGVSRARAIQKRKHTLLPEYNVKHKSNKFVDRRIGEKNYGMSEEDRTMARFTAERMKHHNKKSIYNLADDEVLTHRGQTLSEIEKFDDPRSDDDDDDDVDDEGRKPTGKLDDNFVGDAHFGGGVLTKTGKEGAKSHKDLIDQLIAESKKRKAEKQKTKEETVELTEKLDSDWKDLLPLVNKSKKSNDDKPELHQKPDDYDRVMRELKFEARGNPSDRLKNEDEVAREEKERLEKLEQDRQNRMMGITEKVTNKTNHRSADDLDDNFNYDSDPEETLAYDDEGKMISGYGENYEKEDKDEEEEKDENKEESSVEESSETEDDLSDLKESESESDDEIDKNILIKNNKIKELNKKTDIQTVIKKNAKTEQSKSKISETYSDKLGKNQKVFEKSSESESDDEMDENIETYSITKCNGSIKLKNTNSELDSINKEEIKTNKTQKITETYTDKSEREENDSDILSESESISDKDIEENNRKNFKTNKVAELHQKNADKKKQCKLSESSSHFEEEIEKYTKTNSFINNEKSTNTSTERKRKLSETQSDKSETKQKVLEIQSDKSERILKISETLSDKPKKKRKISEISLEKSSTNLPKSENTATSENIIENELDELVELKEEKLDLIAQNEVIEKARNELPYTYTLPDSYETLQTLLNNQPPEYQDVIIERMIKCNHPSLAPENKENLSRLFVYLLQHLNDVCPDRNDLHIENIHLCFSILNSLTPHLFTLTQLNPINAKESLIEVLKEKQNDYRKFQKQYPGIDVLVFLKIISCLFSTSDFRHQVVTPAFVFISQLLTKCKIKTRYDILYGLFLVTLFIEYTILSKRYLPAVINYLTGILHMCVPKGSVRLIKIHQPFKSNSTLLVLTEKCTKNIDLQMTSDDFTNTEIDPDFKVKILYNILNLSQELRENWKDLSSDLIIFEQFFELLDNISKKNYPQNVQNKILETIDRNLEVQKNRKLKYLIMAQKRPKALRLYEPNIQPVYEFKRGGRMMSREKAEREKLQYKYKKEMKGALREIRRDKSFLGRVKIRGQIQSDYERKEKVKQIYSEASIQQSELNAFDRTKKKK